MNNGSGRARETTLGHWKGEDYSIALTCSKAPSHGSTGARVLQGLWMTEGKGEQIKVEFQWQDLKNI